MSETETKAAKRETVYETVEMSDGTKVEFAGNRKSNKTILEANGAAAGVRFDFRNGSTLSLMLSELSPEMLAYAACHGISQKGGDEYSGVQEPEDMAVAVEEVFTRLRAGEWAATRSAGDSSAGAGVVIRAIMEVTKKDAAFVKAYLQKKLDTAKAAGEKLSRQELYNGFRRPDTPTGAVIKRLEEEKLSKSSTVNAADMLAEIGG